MIQTRLLILFISVFSVDPLFAEKCGQLPDNIRRAVSRAVRFQNSCGEAYLTRGRPLVINDYSSLDAKMYVIDKGICLHRFKIGWGKGTKGNFKGAPMACDTLNSYFTPPGFHVTGPVNASRFGLSDKNSLKLYGLSGQISGELRGILIHPGKMGAVTNGCTSLVPADSAIVHALGHGVLVYNNFGEPDQAMGKMAPGCKSSAGFDERVCQAEARKSSSMSF